MTLTTNLRGVFSKACGPVPAIYWPQIEQGLIAVLGRQALNEAALIAFAKDMLQPALHGVDLNGGDVQEAGLKHGLLRDVTAYWPCGDACQCADVAEFPTTCYRFTEVLDPGIEGATHA